MVIVGYQGIGKSTLAHENTKYIDLESSNFFVDGKRSDDWYIIYCNIAVHLSEQGYNVFTSSHEVVRKELAKRNVDKMIVCPAIKLKDKWIERLELRHKVTINPQEKEKNYKAYMNAVDRYEDNICELMNEEGFEIRIIEHMVYDLSKIVECVR